MAAAEAPRPGSTRDFLAGLENLPRIDVDFGNLDLHGRLRLDLPLSQPSLSALGEALGPGTLVVLWDGQLEADGVILHRGEDGVWVAHVDWPAAAEGADLHDELDTVTTRLDLSGFIERLSRDAERAPEEWESASLPAYLEALAAWTADMDGAFFNLGEPMPQSPSWRLIGQMLLAAKSYE